MVLAGWLSLSAANRVAENVRWQRHTFEVLVKAEQLTSALKDAETVQRGYILTADPRHLDGYSRAVRTVRESLASLRGLTSDNAGQQRRLDAAQTLIDARLQLLDEVLARRRQGTLSEAISAIRANHGIDLMEDIRQRVSAFERAEEALLAERSTGFERSMRWLLIVIFISTPLTVAVVGSAAFRIRRMAQRAERQAAFQQTLLQSADAAIISTDPEGLVTSFNPAAERLLGYAATEAIGVQTAEAWLDVAETAARAQELAAELGRPVEPGLDAIAALPRRGRPETREWTFIRKDGDRVPVLLSVSAIREEGGRLRGFLGIARDIGELKRAEAALRRREAELAHFKSMLDETLDCIFMFEPAELRFVYANRGATAQVGYSVDELLRMTPLDLKPAFTEAAFRAQLEPLLQHRSQSVVFETVHRHKDGHTIAVEVFIQLLDAVADEPLFVNVVRDITQRKQAEQALALERDRLEMALASSNLASWEFDVRSRRIVLDERWAAMIGESPAPTVTTVDALLDLVPLEDRSRIVAATAEVMDGRRTQYRVQHRVQRRNDGWRWIESHGKVVARDAKGRALRMIGTNGDISERKQAEEALLAARDEAERANSAKDVFLATMSHEMRTPLNGLLGLLELVQLSGLPCEQAEAIEIARDSGRNLVRLIDDVLDHAKIEAGKLDIHSEPVSLNRLLERAVNTFHAVASAKNLTLRHSVDSRISASLSADPLRVLQIVGNFISNAVKFTSAGSVQVHAELVERHGDIETVRISVRDTGIGISREAQQRLFQPFSQAGPATSRLYGGTGLGLAISRRLAEMMDGSVGMESELGKGTTMSVTLPLPVSDVEPAEVALPNLQLAAAPAPAPSDADARIEGAVLAVDDNSTNRLLVKRQLAALGIAVQTAADGREALALWRRKRYSLVITDCNMPEMDGYALCREMRQIEGAEGRPRTPVIGWTANVLRDAAEQCEAAGMDDMLAKPAELAMLKKVIEKWLPSPPRTDGATDSAPTIDRRVLDEVTGGDDQMALEILREFRDSQFLQVERVHAALAGDDPSAVARASHRLKGAARTIGATELASVCERIEAAANAENLCAARESSAALAGAAHRTMSALDELA